MGIKKINAKTVRKTLCAVVIFAIVFCANAAGVSFAIDDENAAGDIGATDGIYATGEIGAADDMYAAGEIGAADGMYAAGETGAADGIYAAGEIGATGRTAGQEDAFGPHEWAQFEIDVARKLGILPANASTVSYLDEITREDFCEIIIKAYEANNGRPIRMPRSSPFTDTDNPYVLKAYAKKIASGYPDGSFRPKGLLSRQEAAKMICDAMYVKTRRTVSDAGGAGVGANAGGNASLDGSDIGGAGISADSGGVNTGGIELSYSDAASVDGWARIPINTLSRKGIMNGNELNEIMPLAGLTREQAVALTVRALNDVNGELLDEAAGVYLAGKPYIFGENGLTLYKSDSRLYIQPGESYAGNDCSLTCRVYSQSGAMLYEAPLTKDDDNYYYVYSYDYSDDYSNGYSYDYSYVYSLDLEPLRGLLEGDPSGKKIIDIVAVQASPKGTPSANMATARVTLSPYVNIWEALTGDSQIYSFESDELARARMESISVDVWKIGKNGEKVSSALSLTVNSAVADEVRDIFREIYENPERFPIYTVGGYSWRDGGRSEHNIGTAIDINPNENAFIGLDGVIKSGSYYAPGEDRYSLPEKGSVVQTFLKHGWGWGGYGWASGHDYMHFSYFGT